MQLILLSSYISDIGTRYRNKTILFSLLFQKPRGRGAGSANSSNNNNTLAGQTTTSTATGQTAGSSLTKNDNSITKMDTSPAGNRNLNVSTHNIS